VTAAPQHLAHVVVRSPGQPTNSPSTRDNTTLERLDMSAASKHHGANTSRSTESEMDETITIIV
jgi:hypothetical protein